MSGLSYETVAEKREKARATFIRDRSIQEAKFNEWYARLLKLPLKVLEKIPFDYSNLSTQALIPEWFKEEPDADVVAAQMAEANGKIDLINEIINQLNEEGVKALDEYNRLHGGS